MNAYIVDSEKIIDALSGKTVFLSLDEFKKRIVANGACFCCGAYKEEKTFNDEHVIPEWLLRALQIFDRKITLPNKRTIIYSQYKIPCCEECNKFLGDVFEEEVSAILTKSYDEVAQYIATSGFNKLFLWMSLVFLKVHLKDMQLRWHVHLQKPDDKIGDYYYWASMHHIHCLARSVYTNVPIDREVFGSMLVLPAKHSDEKFDFVDHFMGKGILLKINDIVLMAILDDSGAALDVYRNQLEKITTSLSVFQYREVFARLLHIRISLKEDPQYYTEFDNRVYRIKAKLPDRLELDEQTVPYGELLSFTLSNVIDPKDHLNGELIKHIKNGRWSFLFDQNGNFMPDKQTNGINSTQFLNS